MSIHQTDQGAPGSAPDQHQNQDQHRSADAAPVPSAGTAEPAYRQIRASFDDETVTVYQAYRAGIAVNAARHGRFSRSFNRDRMTWIKPS